MYNNKTIWSTTDRFPDQQIKTAALGSVVNVTRSYDSAGRIAGIQGSVGAAYVQNATFSFDALGNLTARNDSAAGANGAENFCYDVLNRVRGNAPGGVCGNTFTYDVYGNLTKPGVSLSYGTISTNNRLSSINGLTVSYDASGNIVNDGTRSFSYAPYDLPDRITMGAQWSEWGYTGNGQRAFERRGSNTTATGITYQAAPGFFEQDETISGATSTVTEVREYLSTPVGTVGVVITKPGVAATTLYYLQDHLGSNVAAVSDAGVIVNRSKFDVWGLRSVTVGTIDNGDRGYTGHEHLDFGLIHMNGRIYNPTIGRFLQADPIIQSPYDLQNYNRYSYVMNNPLSFTDPTGFSRWTRARDQYVIPIVAYAIGTYLGCTTCASAALGSRNGGGWKGAAWAVARDVAPVITGFAEAGANGGGFKNGLFLAFANALNAAGGCARGRVSDAGCANGAGNAVAYQFASAGVDAAISSGVRYVVSIGTNAEGTGLDANFGSKERPYSNDEPATLRALRSNNPELVSYENKIWDDSQSQGLGGFLGYGRRAIEHALVVYENLKDGSLSYDSQYKGRLDPKTGEYSRIDLPLSLERDGYKLLLVEHTHPFRSKFEGSVSAYSGALRGPSPADIGLANQYPQAFHVIQGQTPVSGAREFLYYGKKAGF
jgi:RHS repeat-associated protein